jgi:hypothetical protein
MLTSLKPYDHYSHMRTTLSLENDAIRSYARRHRLSLGKAASELALREVNGLPVLGVPGDFPVITTRERRETLKRRMKRHLPDANVLLALVWPRHESHATAHDWFAKASGYAWATSPLTQLGGCGCSPTRL